MVYRELWDILGVGFGFKLFEHGQDQKSPPHIREL